MGEQVVAQVKLNVSRNANENPAGQELKDALGERYAKDHQRVGRQFLSRHVAVQTIHCLANDLREQNPDAVIE